MRIRLRLDRIRAIVAQSASSQNHWAIKLGLSRGHWSEILNGKHPYPSARTRQLLVEAFGVPFEELFEVETGPSLSDPSFHAALAGRYLIDRELGQGGMGTVYLARDVKLGRVVAIKVIAPEAVRGIGTQRFLREVGYVARLQHPHIVPLYEAGEAAGYPYYIMPCLRDGSLRDLLAQRRRLGLAEALPLLRGIAAALSHAHVHQILHCDVKPGNVLLAGGHAYVADFGIARVIRSEALEWGRQGGVSISAGTPAYVSPEQANGEPDLDGRSDLYSLGCVAFELLGGRPPFEGRSTLEIIARRFTAPVPDLRALAPELPAAVPAVLERAMALTRGARQRTVRDFLDQLERAARSRVPARVVTAQLAISRGMQKVGFARMPRIGGFMEALGRDIPYALRGLSRRPGFAATAVLTLAVGIGAATSIFSLLYGTLLRPLPYPEADRLLRVRSHFVRNDALGSQSVPNLLDLRERARTLRHLVGFGTGSVNLATEDMPARVPWLRVSSNFFDGLGLEPAMGRAFVEGEDRAGMPRVAVISHRVWQERFGGRPDILDASILLNGAPYQVIGILPASFWFPGGTGSPEVVVPYEWSGEAIAQNRDQRWIEMFARLAPDETSATAEAELRVIFADLEGQYPESNKGWSIRVFPFGDLFGQRQETLRLLSAAVVLVLLIGLVNVANLMLIRAEQRHREFAVRTAIGAGRVAVARGFLVESLTVAGIAGVLGIWLGWLGMKGMLALFGQTLPRADQVTFGGPIILFALVITLLTGLLVGIVPALRINPRRIQDTLRSGRGAGSGGRRLRDVLAVGEVALAVALVFSAGLLFKSFWRLGQEDPGIDPDNALSFWLHVPIARYPLGEQLPGFYRQAVEAVAATPGVEHVGLSTRVPLLGGQNITTLRSPDDPELAASFVEVRSVTPGFFQAAGIRLLRGRQLTEGDGRAEAAVAIINEELARTIFPQGDALGKRINPEGWDGDGYEVVGIVSSVRDFGLARPPLPALYWPYPLWGRQSEMAFIVRTRGDPESVMPAIRQRLQELDPTIPPYNVRTMREVVQRTIGDRWLATSMLTGFSVLALGLAALGIFAVLGFAVQQRTREVGIRVALGATAQGVTALVVGHGLRLIGIGLVVGGGGAFLGSRLVGSLLYDVQPADPATMVGVTLLIGATGVLAALLPARRAARVDPMAVLREE